MKSVRVFLAGAAAVALFGSAVSPVQGQDVACYDRGPVPVDLARGETLTLRLEGPRYRDLDGVDVVSGRGASVEGIGAALGPWVDGGRDLYLTSASGVAASGLRVVGMAGGREATLVPVQLSTTVGRRPIESTVTPAARLALSRSALDRSGVRVDRTRSSVNGTAERAVARGESPPTRDVAPPPTARASRSGTPPRRPPTGQRPPPERFSREATEGRRTPTGLQYSQPIPADQARVISRIQRQARASSVPPVRYVARSFMVDAYTADRPVRRVPADPLLLAAQERGALPGGCTVRVVAGGHVGTQPTRFTQLVPESPAPVGSVVEIHGQYIPEGVAVRLGDQDLTVLDASSVRIRAELPDAPTQGTLRIVRNSDGAAAVLEDQYSVVAPAVPLPYQRMDVDAEGHVMRNAYLMALASLHVYPDVPAEDDVEVYADRVSTQFQAWGLELVEAFDEGGYLSGTLGSDTQGFMLTNEEMLLVAFAGTQNSANLLDVASDLTIALVPAPSAWGTGIYMHAGFMRAADAKLQDGTTLHEKVLAAAVDAQAAGKKIWVTGHSLGGVLAMLVAYRLSHVNDVDIQGVVTFGAPRAGNTGWVEAFEGEFGDRAQRWVNFKDPIPTFPPQIAGFAHPGSLINLDSEGQPDFSGVDMPYAWGPSTISQMEVEHMCYFDLLTRIIRSEAYSMGYDDWPEMEACSAA